MTVNNLIYDYEAVLCAQSDEKLANCYFKNKEKEATLELVRYAIEYVMHYSPREAEMFLTYDTLEKLKILQYIDRNIEFLSGLNEINKEGAHVKAKEKDTMRFLLSLCYPREIAFNYKDYILNIYKDVVDKKISYPKGFFDEKKHGKICAITCLSFAITRYLVGGTVKSIPDLYALFGKRKECTKLLKKYSLVKPLKDIYAGNTLSYLHNSLNSSQRDEFLYFHYRTLEQYNTINKSLRQKKKNNTSDKFNNYDNYDELDDFNEDISNDFDE